MDVAIGAQIRALRRQFQVGPGVLAEAIGVSPQQLQKYEEGSNRITATRLYALAGHLNVPISRLFRTPSPGVEDNDGDFYNSEAGVELARDFQLLSEPHQRFVVKMMRALRDSETEKAD